MNYKVVIADDELKAITILNELLKSFKDYEVVDLVRDCNQIIQSVIEKMPDLLLMDINFGEKTGIELAKEIRSINPSVEIIFVTAYPDYAMDAFNCKACDYLVKPVSLSRLSKALKHFEEHVNAHYSSLPNSSPTTIRFNTQQGFIIVKPEEIVCLEADQVYTSIRTIDNKIHHVSQNIGKIEQLLDSSHFIRVSRSGIVNSSFVSEISRTNKKCILRWNGDKHDLSMSKSGIEKLEQIF